MDFNLTQMVVEVVLTGLFFWLVMPKVRGAHFSGSPFEAFLYAAIFQVVKVAVIWALGIAAVTLGIVTHGVGLIPVVLAAVFFFWLLPAVQLQAMAWVFPRVMAFDSFGSSVLCGLGLLVISCITGDFHIKIN